MVPKGLDTRCHEFAVPFVIVRCPKEKLAAGAIENGSEILDHAAILPMTNDSDSVVFVGICGAFLKSIVGGSVVGND
jgi:nucleoside phosphorylase